MPLPPHIHTAAVLSNVLMLLQLALISSHNHQTMKNTRTALIQNICALVILPCPSPFLLDLIPQSLDDEEYSYGWDDCTSSLAPHRSS
ncbi:hypothetical protein P692DRAFT_20872411 [Suillus brevipes Sb2]|nr:hypothetical protein P692DRAFT_20872411 [Suillus brevipes Sb2]